MALKLVLPENKCTIDLPEGAKVFLERPTKEKQLLFDQEAKEKGLKNIIKKTVDTNTGKEVIDHEESLFSAREYVFERYIVGWEGIEDDKGKPHPVNDITRAVVYSEIFKKEHTGRQFITFLLGNLGN
jgi:hypothetical protein